MTEDNREKKLREINEFLDRIESAHMFGANVTKETETHPKEIFTDLQNSNTQEKRPNLEEILIKEDILQRSKRIIEEEHTMFLNSQSSGEEAEFFINNYSPATKKEKIKSEFNFYNYAFMPLIAGIILSGFISLYSINKELEVNYSDTVTKSTKVASKETAPQIFGVNTEQSDVKAVFLKDKSINILTDTSLKSADINDANSNFDNLESNSITSVAYSSCVNSECFIYEFDFTTFKKSTLSKFNVASIDSIKWISKTDFVASVTNSENKKFVFSEIKGERNLVAEFSVNSEIVLELNTSKSNLLLGDKNEGKYSIFDFTQKIFKEIGTNIDFVTFAGTDSQVYIQKENKLLLANLNTVLTTELSTNFNFKSVQMITVEGENLVVLSENGLSKISKTGNLLDFVASNGKNLVLTQDHKVLIKSGNKYIVYGTQFEIPSLVELDENTNIVLSF